LQSPASAGDTTPALLAEMAQNGRGLAAPCDYAVPILPADAGGYNTRTLFCVTL